MSPVTHLLTGWVVANTTTFSRRERALVTLAGVAPDVDGLGAIPEVLTRNTSHPLLWFSQYHHVMHNALFGLTVAVVSFLLATRRWKTALLALLAFHIHLLEDIAGARGPEGYGWPIPYLLPFSKSVQWQWSGQWPLNGWQNFLITAILLLTTFYLAWVKGHSPLELVSEKADQKFVGVLWTRFPRAA
jgi:inner membrane protein